MKGGFVYNLVKIMALFPDTIDKPATERAIKRAWLEMVADGHDWQLAAMYIDATMGRVIIGAWIDGELYQSFVRIVAKPGVYIIE